MEALEKITSLLFGRGQEQKSKRWDYEYFREYLLALTKGKNFLLPSEQYPEKIELSQNWHETLNKLRKDSEDGIERLILIGFKENQRAIYLPTVGEKATPDRVTSEVYKNARERAATKYGITLLGDIHSHPTRTLEKLLAALSPIDFHGMIAAKKFFPLMGVVEGNEQVFAFLAKEGIGLGIDPSAFTAESFSKHWYQKSGYSWEMNRSIAERHKLVLYRGRANQDLIKVFPKPT